MHRPNFKLYEHNKTVGWTRIDLILAVYDRAVRELEQSRILVEQGQITAVRPRLARAQIAIGALLAGNNPQGSELEANFYRLHEFIIHSLADAELGKLDGALQVVRTLREGFQAIRTEALDLERTGAIPPLDRAHAVQATG